MGCRTGPAIAFWLLQLYKYVFTKLMGRNFGDMESHKGNKKVQETLLGVKSRFLT